MTHKDFIAELSQRTDWTQLKTSEFVDVAVAIMNEKLAENQQIIIQNFGVFDTKKKGERLTINPATKERYLVPPKIVVGFSPSTSMKDRLRKLDSND